MKFEAVKVEKPAEVNVIIGQAHFIKTVEDLYEVLVSSMPNIKFGLAFCESSGECLIRSEGNDEALKALACKNALELACGHSFIILLKEAYPINVLNRIKAVEEVCALYCATANPVEVLIAETESGRGILGVIDGARPKAIENEDGVNWRHGLLRKFGYKR